MIVEKDTKVCKNVLLRNFEGTILRKDVVACET